MKSGKSSLGELASVLLKLRTVAFGGPAAHIAMMHDETVKRRKWLSDQEFLDLMGATNLIPGPNSTEMAIHIGYLRAGWPGLITGGICFIVPAVIIVLSLAWIYVRFGTIPEAGWLLYGVKPVVIAIILQALWGLSRKAVKNPTGLIVTVAVIALYFAGINEIALLFAAGLIMMIAANFNRLRKSLMAAMILPLGNMVASPEISEASKLTGRQARDTRTPQYSQPAPPPGQAGPMVMDYHVPLFTGEQYTGSIVASYLTANILDEMVPWWFAQHN